MKYYGQTNQNNIVVLGSYERAPLHLIGCEFNDQGMIRQILTDDDLYRFIQQSKECLNTKVD
jgi:hypothetical protein